MTGYQIPSYYEFVSFELITKSRIPDFNSWAIQNYLVKHIGIHSHSLAFNESIQSTHLYTNICGLMDISTITQGQGSQRLSNLFQTEPKWKSDTVNGLMVLEMKNFPTGLGRIHQPYILFRTVSSIFVDFSSFHFAEISPKPYTPVYYLHTIEVDIQNGTVRIRITSLSTQWVYTRS